MKKKTDFFPKCLPTGIGSLPQTEAQEACELILKTLSQIPFWPQLPKRSARENMYWQYSENLPGVTFEEDRMCIHTPEDFASIEKFYEHFLSEDLDFFSISKPFAAGFYQLQEYKDQLQKAWAVKGQITGPVSFALQVTDENRRSLLYNEELKDIVVKNLLRKANWQESILTKYNSRVIMFLDEPYLSAFGSAFTSLNREQVIDSLEEVLQGINSSLDAYAYASNLLLYKEQLKKYLERGGTIAWGIIPTSEEILQNISVEILAEKLEKIWADLVNLGIDRDQLLSASLITPACGLGTMHQDMAVKALTLTGNLSQMLREKYKLV